jgi:hypothetical protein
MKVCRIQLMIGRGKKLPTPSTKRGSLLLNKFTSTRQNSKEKNNRYHKARMSPVELEDYLFENDVENLNAENRPQCITQR